MKKYYWILLLLVMPLLTWAQPSINLRFHVGGFTDITDVQNAGDERLFVVEQDGRIWIVDSALNTLQTEFLDIDNQSTSSGNEQGLLGLAFHPNYKQNGYFFVNYTNNQGNTVVSRWSVSAGNPNVADPNSEVVLMTINQPYTNHNGGQIRFGHDGYLYIGMGDGGSAGDPQNFAQNTNSYLGKTLRIDVDSGNPYAVPADNPFVSDTNTLDEIWHIGLRNQWRFSFDLKTGDMWIGDVGQNNWEEIDFQPANSPGGENYGWRCYEGNNTYNTSGCQPQNAYVDPVYVYANNAQTGCSVTGGSVYRSAKERSLYGYYFFTDYCTGHMWVTLQDTAGNFTTNNIGTFAAYKYTTFGEDMYGRLYVAERSGDIYEIEDTSNCFPAADIWGGDVICQGDSTELSAAVSPGLTYTWMLNGSPIAGATDAEYFAKQAGSYQIIVEDSGCIDTSDVYVLSMFQSPTVSFSGLQTLYCTDDPSDTLVGSPAGGTFAGPGISGNIFTPDTNIVGVNTITYTYSDSNGCAATDTMEAQVEVCVGVNSEKEISMKLFPNPTDGKVSILYSHFGDGSRISVSDLRGVEIMNHEIGTAVGTNRLELELPNAGVYIVTLQSGDISVRKRLLVLK